LNESETREEDETYQNPVDMMFQELEERDPQHFAVRQYKKIQNGRRQKPAKIDF